MRAQHPQVTRVFLLAPLTSRVFAGRSRRATSWPLLGTSHYQLTVKRWERDQTQLRPRLQPQFGRPRLTVTHTLRPPF